LTPKHPDPRRIEGLLAGRDHAPAELLGPSIAGETATVMLHLPNATSVQFDDGTKIEQSRWPGVFRWQGATTKLPRHYRIMWRDAAGQTHETMDPYSFAVGISAHDQYLFNEGKHRRSWELLGAHALTVDDIAGIRFSVWAPNAERVSVVGDFNAWDGRCHPMNVQGNSGIWCLYVPELGAGQRYKYEIRTRPRGALLLKADPYAQQYEYRPATASVVAEVSVHQWNDEQWMMQRRQRDTLQRAISIYEVHLGSWQRTADGSFLNYRALATQLLAHVQRLGFTHIELLPVTEHPFDASWGYQTLGYFAATNRFGSADDLRWFIDHFHQHNIGVILDWVPAHFPRDDHGLANFDGTALYEHADPRLGEHRDWNTLIFNYGRNEVRNFLTSSALYWLHEFHIDGLRVDAVASMLYLDYSRKPGEWLPNRFGGRENLDAVAWLRELNEATHGESPGTLIIAEESTAWPAVTRPTYVGGLGFTLKWNMGWMNDTLRYMRHDPVHRSHEHRHLTFGMLYAYSENFVLPFSHDEVVHGKGSMLGKMPGDDWQKFANLRLLYTYMYTLPGKKLLFMGNEFGDRDEWNHDRALRWQQLDFAPHRGIYDLVAVLNRLYRDDAAFALDFDEAGFTWIDCDDVNNSVISYQRRCGPDYAVVVLNFTPVPRHNYRVGVPDPGFYRELFNSDSSYYGGSNLGNAGRCRAERTPASGYKHSLLLTLPPLAGIVLKPDRSSAAAT
jgi:1,4-alpha-glucan branching enzyme